MSEYEGYKRLAMRSLTMRDYRCFKDATIDFNGCGRKIRDDSGLAVDVAPLTVLLAKNGRGKTAILDAIRILFGTFTAAFPSKSLVSADENSIRLELNPDGRTSMADQLSIEGCVLVDGNEYMVCRTLSANEGARTTSREVKVIADYAKRLFKSVKSDDGVVLPILAYYGTGRLWASSKDSAQKRMLLKRRDFGYKECLSIGHNFKEVNRWLVQAVGKRLVSERDNLLSDEVVEAQIRAISRALDHVLKKEGYRADITFDGYTQALAIRKEVKSGSAIALPISTLSDGVKAAFGLVADIAFRCAKLNPQLGESAPEKTDGIVLIDEVDLHLHPSWQQTILRTLQLAFPCIQFIVTTHSPQVISSVPRECIRIITDEGIVGASVMTEGAKAGQVLSLIFDTHERVSEAPLTRDINAYRAMLDQGTWNTASGEALWARLEEQMQTDPELATLKIDRMLKNYDLEHTDETHS